MIPGIDVSHWQKQIDWQKVKKAGVRFAFFKATEFVPGRVKMYTDTELVNNAYGCTENKIRCAPYHFYRTHIDPVTQAFGFLDAIEDIPFSMRPVLDLEVAGKKGKSLCQDVLLWLETVEDELKCKPIIYTSGGFWRSYMIYDRFDNVECFAGYPFWQAQWSFYLPKPVYPFPYASFWQYSETGRIPGVITHVDLDYYMGDEISFLTMLLLHRPKSEPKPTNIKDVKIP